MKNRNTLVVFVVAMLLHLECPQTFAYLKDQKKGAQQTTNLGEKLYSAVHKGDIYASKRLLAKGIDVNSRYMDGETLLMRAAVDGHTDVVKLLIQKGANVNQNDSFGFTALGLAVLNNRLIIVQYLLKHKANVNGMLHGELPLVLAADKSNLQMTRLLLANGANVDDQDRWGNTALIAATARDTEALVSLLLDKKANPSIRNKRGENALSIAEKGGKSSLILLLSGKSPLILLLRGTK